MSVLIVEDQFLIAMALEEAVLAAGHRVAGIVASRAEFERLSSKPTVALVDVNLSDGPTGPSIGEELAQQGCRVIFMTGNPEMLEQGGEGVLGVMTKPVFEDDMIDAIAFASGDSDRIPRALRLSSEFEPISGPRNIDAT